ncbi:hypothetical protein EGW08_003194 [Elysia chlorotica]|uniref:Uncharacterized protein n=1 Tax=Elysia chlorotica TaxID=188477 RepID=A0A433U5E3_ELYCH|nr:hypothetical protein EGW08_003194 [Elysia chlorotica]
MSYPRAWTLYPKGVGEGESCGRTLDFNAGGPWFEPRSSDSPSTDYGRINSLYRGCGIENITGCDPPDELYPTCTMTCVTPHCNDLHGDLRLHLRSGKESNSGNREKVFFYIISFTNQAATIEKLRQPLLASLSRAPMSASVHRFDNFRSGPDRKGIATPYGPIGAVFDYIKNMLRRWRSLKKIVYAALILFLTIIIYATTAGDGYEQDSNPDWKLPLVSREDLKVDTSLQEPLHRLPIGPFEDHETPVVVEALQMQVPSFEVAAPPPAP